MASSGRVREAAAEQERRLQWLVVWRLVVGVLLLGGTLWLSLETGLAAEGFTSMALTALIVLTFATSALVAGGRIAGWSLRSRALGALAADLVLATGLVYVSGGAGSAFSILYGAAVLSAAIILGGRAATLATAASIVLYVVVALAVTAGWIAAPPDQSPAAYRLDVHALGVSLLSNVVGLVVVGALSVALAGRLSRERGVARAAEEERARLSRLNDDIVRSLSSGLMTLGEGDRITSINPAGVQLLGAPEEDVVGAPVEAVLGFRPGLDERAEAKSQLADGRELILGYSRTPLVEASGRSLLLFQDLTEIEELRDAARRAERLALLGHLAAGLAHEIRNPLGSIHGSVQLVRESGALDDEDAALLDLVKIEVRRLNELVSTMLAVGRPATPQPRPVDVASLAREVARLVEGDADLVGRRTVVVEAPDVLEAEVDPDGIRQVIWNLVKNGLQASPEGEQVTVRLRSAGDALELEVEDRGAGVPEDERRRLFESFYTRRARGIGLGLALVHQIVRGHGGEIRVTDGAGGGALFQITLPRRFETAGEPEAKGEAPP